MPTNNPFTNGPGENPFDLSGLIQEAQQEAAKAQLEAYNREDSAATAEVLAKLTEYLVNEKGYSPELARQAAFLTAQGHYWMFHHQILVRMLVETIAGMFNQ